jgi:hypothetical protein
MRLMGHVARVGKKRNSHEIFVGNLERKKKTPRRGRENSIRIDLQVVELEGVEWILLEQNKDRRQAHMNAVMNLRARKMRRTS